MPVVGHVLLCCMQCARQYHACCRHAGSLCGGVLQQLLRLRMPGIFGRMLPDADCFLVFQVNVPSVCTCLCAVSAPAHAPAALRRVYKTTPCIHKFAQGTAGYRGWASLTHVRGVLGQCCFPVCTHLSCAAQQCMPCCCVCCMVAFSCQSKTRDDEVRSSKGMCYAGPRTPATSLCGDYVLHTCVFPSRGPPRSLRVGVPCLQPVPFTLVYPT